MNHVPHRFLAIFPVNARRAIMYKFLLLMIFSTFSSSVLAAVDLTLRIRGKHFNVERGVRLGDPGSPTALVEFDFLSKTKSSYHFRFEHKALPSSRSYPRNLDITISDGKGEKLGYLFFALNDLSFLEKIGRFDLKVETSEGLANFEFLVAERPRGTLDFSVLEHERFVQDTLLETKSFQMIRPVIPAVSAPGLRRTEYPLDHFPYSVEYLARDIGSKRIEFEHNLYKMRAGEEKTLALAVYFQANSLAELREVMFAARVFGLSDGPAKIVFYPTMGQLEPR